MSGEETEQKMVPASPESTTEQHQMAPASLESAAEQHQMAPASPESDAEQHQMAPASPESDAEQHQMAPASPEWTTDQGPWLLLVCIPHVVSDEDFPPNTNLSLLREDPPLASRITVSRLVAPDPKDIYNHPYVAAVGGFGRFLLYATQGTQPEQQAVDDFDTQAEARLDYMGRKATRLPDPERPIRNHGNVGLVTSPAESIVVELQPLVGTNCATFLCYFSSSGAWVVHTVHYNRLTPVQRMWRGGDGVINFQDQMMFVDLAFGMFTLAIPLLGQRRPELHYVPLPEGRQKEAHSSGHAQRRCIGVSEGKVRFVEIDVSIDEPTICLWTLLNLDTGEWYLDSEISVEQLWDDENFKAMDLPQENPAVAFVHPEHSNIVYFFLDSRIFSVNMMTGQFLSGNFFDMDNPPADYHSSRFVRPWRLTPEHFHDGDFNGQKNVTLLSETSPEESAPGSTDFDQATKIDSSSGMLAE